MKDKKDKVHNFKVIRGGLSFQKSKPRNNISAEKITFRTYPDTLHYKSGYATNTLLHKEMCIHVVWEDLSVPTEPFVLHEFVYFSYAENLFVNYVTDVNEPSEELLTLESTLLKNLGAEKIPINEGVAKYLFYDFSISYDAQGDFQYNDDIDYTEELELYKHLLGSPLNDPSRRYSRSKFIKYLPKLCRKPKTPYGVINTFMMNFVSESSYVASFLCDNSVDYKSQLPDSSYTLYRNNIEKKDDLYFCEALISDSTVSKIATFSFKLDPVNMTILDFQKLSLFPISDLEVAMIVSRSEYVSVFQLAKKNENTITDSLSAITHGAKPTQYEHGKLYAVMDPYLEYIESPNFIIRDSFKGSIFLNDASQLILSSLNRDNLKFLEKAIVCTPLKNSLFPKGFYIFQEPLFYDYIYSDFILFEDFVSFFE